MNAKAVATKEPKFSDLATKTSKASEQPEVNGDTEGRSQNVDVKGKKVTCTYYVRKSSGDKSHTLHTVFDFTNVSEAEMYALAMYAVRVKAQALWRSKDIDPLDANKGFEKMDVKSQIVDQARAPKDPGVAARKALDKLTDEQKAAIMAELEKSLKK